MIEVLRSEATAQHVIVATLAKLPPESRRHVYDHVAQALFGVRLALDLEPSVPDDDELDTRTDLADCLPPEEAEPEGPRKRIRLGPPDRPKTPRGLALDETVALAIKLGHIENRDIAMYRGMTQKGADLRIQRARIAGRIVRVSQGVYQAADVEYDQLGFPPEKRGVPMQGSIVATLAIMTAARSKADPLNPTEAEPNGEEEDQPDRLQR